MPKLSDFRNDQIVLLGKNCSYVIGDVAYKLRRQPVFSNGTLGTMNLFASLSPVVWIEDKWQPTDRTKTLIKNWSDECTPIN